MHHWLEANLRMHCNQLSEKSIQGGGRSERNVHLILKSINENT